MSKRKVEDKLNSGKSPGKGTSKKPPGVKRERYPHFRYYRKSEHPALITAEHTKDEYKYRKVTSSNKPEGGRNPEKVSPNPDKTKSTPMYIHRRTRHDKKIYFDKNKLPWKYKPKKDNKK